MDTAVGNGTLGDLIFIIILFGVLILFIVFCFMMFIGTSKAQKRGKIERQQKAANLQSQGVSTFSTMKHIDGLPIVSGVNCEVISFPGKITVKANGTEFNLEKSKLTDVSIKTDVEIEKQMVSSIGGAVGGAILFGGLGAIVGGRAREKKSRTVTQYLIFTYNKDNDIKFVSFEIMPNSLKQAGAFVDEFRSNPNKNIVVDL